MKSRLTCETKVVHANAGSRVEQKARTNIANYKIERRYLALSVFGMVQDPMAVPSRERRLGTSTSLCPI